MESVAPVTIKQAEFLCVIWEDLFDDVCCGLPYWDLMSFLKVDTYELGMMLSELCGRRVLDFLEEEAKGRRHYKRGQISRIRVLPKIRGGFIENDRAPVYDLNAKEDLRRLRHDGKFRDDKMYLCPRYSPPKPKRPLPPPDPDFFPQPEPTANPDEDDSIFTRIELGRRPQIGSLTPKLKETFDAFVRLSTDNGGSVSPKDVYKDPVFVGVSKCYFHRRVGLLFNQGWLERVSRGRYKPVADQVSDEIS